MPKFNNAEISVEELAAQGWTREEREDGAVLYENGSFRVVYAKGSYGQPMNWLEAYVKIGDTGWTWQKFDFCSENFAPHTLRIRIDNLTHCINYMEDKGLQR